MAYKWGYYSLLTNWDDPPSREAGSTPPHTPESTNGWIPKNDALEKVAPALNMAIFCICQISWGVK